MLCRPWCHLPCNKDLLVNSPKYSVYHLSVVVWNENGGRVQRPKLTHMRFFSHPNPFKPRSQPSTAVLGATARAWAPSTSLPHSPLAQLLCMRGRLSTSSFENVSWLGEGCVFIFLNICLKYFVRASKTIPVFIFYIFLITMIYLLITSVSG